MMAPKPATPAANRIERYLQTLLTQYRIGISGHAPLVARSVTAALGFVLTDARDQSEDGEVTVAAVHAALIRAATAAARNAAYLAARVDTAHEYGAVAFDTYRAAWAAATADELRAIQRALETQFATEH